MLKIVVKMPPITKKNSQRIFYNQRKKKPFVAPSKAYKDYEGEAYMYFLNYRERINYPVNIKCLFYMPTRRKCDLTNLLEAIDDIMVKAEVIEDDNYTIVQSHDGSRVFYDKENPRTEIYIEEI